MLDRPAAELVRARRSACIGPQALCPVGNGAGHLSQFLSHSPLSGAIHQRPPRSCSGRSRTVADAGERWPALLESVLGATPREFESRILRHADLLRRAWVTFARCAMSHGACLIFCLSLGPGHMPYSGQIGVVVR